MSPIASVVTIWLRQATSNRPHLLQASSFTAPSACPTHVKTNPCALESGSSPSSASIRTFPPSSFALQTPHCPCLQDEGLATPCSPVPSNSVCPLRTSPAEP